MARLEWLTQEQEALLPVVREKWIAKALGGQKQLCLTEVKPHVEWLYSLAGLESPIVVCVDSPLAAQYAANVLASDRAQVRAQVWDQVGDQVRAQVWDQVRAQVGDQYHQWAYIGLAYDSGWTSFYDVFSKIGIVRHELFPRWREFLGCGVWDCILFRGVAILCSCPSSVHLDRPDLPRGQQRLHRLDGPAVEWRDGYRNYYVAGVAVDGGLIENPSQITRERILDERNAEVRKALIQVLGLPSFLEMTDAQVLDEDIDSSGMPRRLLSIDAGAAERWCVVEVECPSKHDKHYLWVPPGMTRCSQAVAWTFGFESVEQYDPLVEA